MKVLHSLLLAGLLCLVPSLADAQVTVTDWRGETVDATAGSVDSDGVRIVYHTAGEGPLVIFVHGVASPWHDYRRYSAIDENTLHYEATMTDPEVFTRPWTIRMPLYRRVEEHAELLEYKCVEFAEELLYGHLRRQPRP